MQQIKRCHSPGDALSLDAMCRWLGHVKKTPFSYHVAWHVLKKWRFLITRPAERLVQQGAFQRVELALG
ncbi:MAG: hypothetical protein Q8K62_03015 [Thiobacillus sp.]|nr:hypothetical protein [Thiobacillus sp.]